MTDERESSTTVRIDLLPSDPVKPEAAQASRKSASSVTRMDWSRSKKAPEYVSRSRYQELLNSLYDATVITNLSGIIVDANNRATQHLGYEKSQLVSMSVTKIISGADTELIDSVRDNLNKERYTVIQAYLLRKDESYFPAEIAVSKVRLDEPCLAFFMRDTTLRVEAETRVLLEHQALQIGSTAVVITDLEGAVSYANPAFLGLLKVEETESVDGRSLASLIAETDAEEVLIAAIENEEAVEMVSVLHCADGSSPDVRIVAAANWSADGEPLGVALCFEPA